MTTTTGEWFDAAGWLTRDIPAECAADCSHSGDCLPDVEAWRERLGFTVPRDLAIRYLREFGAWDDEELTGATDDTLANRVLWIACGDLSEQGEWLGLVH